MKPYILGALAVWFLMGFTGAILLGRQRPGDVGSVQGRQSSAARSRYGPGSTSRSIKPFNSVCSGSGLPTPSEPQQSCAPSVPTRSWTAPIAAADGPLRLRRG